MKILVVFAGALGLLLSAPWAQAQQLELERHDTTRDRALKNMRAAAPGELAPAAQDLRRRWQARATALLQERFPEASRDVRVEVTPLGIVRLTGRAPNLAAKLAMARAIMERPDIGLMVDNALAPFEGEQAAVR